MDTVKTIPDSVIANVLDYESLIQGLEESFAQFSLGSESGILQPDRLWVSIPEQNGIFGSMPVYSRYNNMLSTKMITVFPNNKDVPSHCAVIMVFNAENGRPVAILDGEVITTKRTAAASAAATKFLTNGKPEVLALLGSGVQSRSHYAALSHLYDFKQVKIWNHRKVGAEKMATDLGDKVIACDNVEEAVRDADVIVTATIGTTTPILKASWVKKGAHINAVGACQPDRVELDGELMRSSVVYADSRQAVSKESGNVIQSKAPVFAEIGEVINGTKEARRQEITVFESVGMSIQDAVAAKIVLDRVS